jgi:hypothetical protein
MNALREFYGREEVGRESIDYITSNFKSIIRRPSRNYVFKHDPSNTQKAWKLLQGTMDKIDNEVKQVIYKGKPYYYVKTKAYDYGSALHSAKDILNEFLDDQSGE